MDPGVESIRDGQTFFRTALIWATIVISGATLGFASQATAYIYWADSAGDIGRAQPDGTQINRSFIEAEDTPVGLDVSASHIYWTDFREGTIGRANLDGSGVQPRFITGLSFPQGVAVNASHIYWSSADGIGRATIDGTSPQTNFIPSIDQADAIDLTPTHVYFSVGGSSVGRAELDGSGVEPAILTSANFGVDNVAVDSAHLYFTQVDAEHPVARADLSGANPDLSFITTAPRPYNNAQGAVAADNRFVYWAQLAPSSTIGRAAINGTAPDPAFISTGGSPRGIAVDSLPTPVTTITGGPQGITTSPGASFAFADGQIGSSFECRIDSSAFTACASPVAYTALEDGDHRFEVRSTTSWGSREVSPAARNFAIDTRVAGGVDAKSTQRQKGKRIEIDLDVAADEDLSLQADGKVKVGRKLFPLRGASREVLTDAVITLAPTRGNARKIARQIKHGKRPVAMVTASLTDAVGHTASYDLEVTLTH